MCKKITKRQKGIDLISETTMAENFPQINVSYQTTDSGNAENTRQGKCPSPKPHHPWPHNIQIS